MILMMTPSVRARHPQTLLALVRASYGDRYPAVAERLRHREAIEGRLPVEWIRIEADVELLEALIQALPARAVETLLRERQRQEMGSALFKTFVATIGKLVGLTPTSLMRQIPKGWGQVFQECGAVEVRTVEDRTAELVVSGLPRVCLESAAWLDAVPVGMATLYELVGARGQVRRRPTSAGGDVGLSFEW
jgi:hypothetical protein